MVGGRTAGARVGVPTRIRVALRSRCLDRALAEGADPLASPALGLRAQRLTRRRNRVRLAESIERTLVAATTPSRGRSAAVAPPRPVIEAARLPLLRIEAKLLSEGPVYAQGIARLRLLLTDGGSALYAPANPAELTDELERIIAGLEGVSPGRER
jgi:hypothetical protein